MFDMKKSKFFWKVVYFFWPPLIRCIETLGFHDFRQKYLLGRLNYSYDKNDLVTFLSSNGFETARIAWHDPGEVLSMRRLDKDVFQYHIRLFADGEIRAHYEYSPESHPVGHVFEKHFKPETEFYKNLLSKYLVVGK